MRPYRLLALFCALGLLCSCASISAPTANDPLAWPALTKEQKPWAYWWWMGSAVDKENITRSMQRYHDAGMGGVHIIPIYGAKGWEDRYIEYLSPKWMEMMGWAVSEARRLGMDVDMTTGTGWCFGGGPYVGEKEGNANVVWKTYDVATGGKLTEKFDKEKTQALVAFMPEGKTEELTGKIADDGSVDWTAPADAKVYSVSQRLNSQKVKRAAPGGEGPMLNLIYPDAMKVFLREFTEAFNKYTGPKPRAQYHDSYEYKSDWAPDFFEQFEKHRGYKLQDELPALFSNDTSDRSARVKSDYRETVSDIMVEDSLPQWVKWSHDRGFLTRNEAHGSPGNLLDLYDLSDAPETEMFNRDRNKLVSKFASSAAHVTGKKFVGSETGTWLAEHFTEKLSDMKYLLDDLFLSGINHIYYHGCCYSPDEVPWPGWVFYASYEMNPRNAVWHDVLALNTYAARCQAILQSGRPDNDILIYWPIHDFWMQPGNTLLPHMTVHAREWFENQPIGKTAEQLWNRGYSFDYFSDRELKAAKVKDGKIEMPDNNYRVIVVPDCKYLPLETMNNLRALAAAGATVIFEGQLPSDVPGWANLETRRNELKEAINEIKMEDAGNQFKAAKVSRGKFLAGDVENALTQAGVRREAMFDHPGLMCIRRVVDGEKAYFIANRGEQAIDGWIPLAATVRSAVSMDALSGRTGVAKVQQKDTTQIYLQLQPGDSVILRTLANGEIKSPEWNYWETQNSSTPISGEWNVSFVEGGPTLPASFTTKNLGSWTSENDTNAQSFAGAARYSITFDAPNANAQPSLLDLGKVCQSARVKLNGQDYGTLITPPFRVVVNNLKPKGNVLEVEVTSTSANRIRDLDRRGVQWQNFHDINFVNQNYRPFDASNWPLADEGLLGPVTLTPVSVRLNQH